MRQLWSTVQPLWNNEAELELRNIPIVNTIIASTYAPSPNTLYYENRNQYTRSVNIMRSEVAAGSRDVDDPAYLLALRRNAVFKRIDSAIGKLAKKRNMYEYRSKEYDAINEQMQRLMRISNAIMQDDEVWNNDGKDFTRNLTSAISRYSRNTDEYQQTMDIITSQTDEDGNDKN